MLVAIKFFFIKKTTFEVGAQLKLECSAGQWQTWNVGPKSLSTRRSLLFFALSLYTHQKRRISHAAKNIQEDPKKRCVLNSFSILVADKEYFFFKFVLKIVILIRISTSQYCNIYTVICIWTPFQIF